MKNYKHLLFIALLLILLFSTSSALAGYTIGDDYPYSGGAIDAPNIETNFSTRECTDFVAHCLRTRNKVSFTNQYANLGRWGHAGDWIDSGNSSLAQAAGVVVDNTPAVGAVACWNKAAMGNDTGHVAWVVSVNGNDVTIEEYNAATADNGWTSYIWGRRTISSSNPTAYIHIKDIDITPPEIYTTLDVYNVSSKGFTISFYAMDNVGIDKVYAAIRPTPNFDETLSDKTVYGSIDADNKATIRVNIDNDIGYLGESYRITCYVEDAAGNVDVYPSRGKMLYLYKIDTTDTGTYRAVRETTVYSFPRVIVNGYNTSAYTLNANDVIDDVWGSYYEDGVKWYRFGQSQWVLAEDFELKEGYSSLSELLDGFLQKLIYIINGQPVYASENVENPVELSGGHVRWVYKPNDVSGGYQIGDLFTMLENLPYELTLISINGVEGFRIDAYFGDDVDLVIPERIATYPIIAIDDSAFADDDDLQSIIIPDYVVSIGENAFCSCQNLTRVHLPSGLREIARSIFDNCQSLVEINIPSTVVSIGAYAFNNCKELEITIPDTLEEVGVGGFGFDSPYSRVKRVWCHAGTTAADVADRFSSPNCPDYCLNQYHYQDECYLGIVKYYNDEENVIIPSEIDGVQVTNIWYYVFRSKSLASITVPSTVTSIGESAFAGCGNLVSIDLPDSISNLDEGVFASCNNLVSVHLPNQITEIPERAFEDCRKLEEIIVPEPVTRLGNRAFNYCLQLEISLPDTIESVGVGCFGYDSPNSRVKKVLCHAGTLTASCVDQFYSPSQTDFKISQSNTSEGSKLTILKYVGDATSVTIPAEIDMVPVVTIGYRAFAYTQVKEVSILQNITSIDSTAFAGISGLTIYGIPGSYAEEYASGKNYTFISMFARIEPDIVLPAALTIIEDEAFYGCTFRAVEVPDSVYSIGSKAFSNCSNLTQIVIPSSVVIITEDAFDSSPNVVIFCSKGSVAEEYAIENGFAYVTTW